MNSDKLEDLLIEIKDQIGTINVALGKIDTKLDADYHALYGNGKPGLIHDVVELTKRVIKLEEKNKHNGTLWIIVGFIINAAISLAAIFCK